MGLEGDMRTVVTRLLPCLALSAASCGSTPCTVAAQITTSGDASQCGSLDLVNNQSLSAAQMAQMCVEHAESSGSGFVLNWTSLDEQGPTTEAYSSAGLGTPLYHYLSQSFSEGGAEPNVTRWTCASIDVTSGCTLSAGNFCLSCTGETDAIQLCGNN
jgi:hypothetical protein